MFHNIYKFIKKCIVEPGAHRPKGGAAAGPIRPWIGGEFCVKNACFYSKIIIL